MRLLALCSAFCVLCSSASAQWHYLSGGRLSGISSVGSRVWTVGQNGLFFYSEDNGAHWRRIPGFTARNLVDVEFWDAGLGLITAEGDMVYRTSDNGATWDSTYVQAAGGRIRFVSHDFVWLLKGWGGWRSRDGGRSWQLAYDRAQNSWMLDSIHGWCTYISPGTGGTDDGGATWVQRGSVGYPGTPQAFGFRNPMQGICSYSFHVGGHSGYTAHRWAVTVNSGSSWTDLAEANSYGVTSDVDAAGRVYGLSEQGCLACSPSGTEQSWFGSEFLFIDISAARGQHAWICGAGGAVWRSTDSGQTWMPTRPQSLYEIRDVSFSDSLHGWVASTGNAASTSDAGRSWATAGTPAGTGTISDIAALGASTAALVSGWAYYDLWRGWIGHFSLLRTSDAGVTWDTAREFWEGDGPMASSRFCRVGPYIWHPGTRAPGGNSLRSTDGGATWFDMDTLGTTGQEPEPADISFIDSLNGWAIDPRASVRRTTDGGSSWVVVAETVGVKRLQMLTVGSGWGLTDTQLVRTTDGGVSWTVVTGGRRLSALSFADTRHGAVVGEGGFILRTSDGGQTWNRDSSEFTSDLYDVLVLDSEHMWAAGEHGLVLGYGDWAVGADEPAEPRPTRDLHIALMPNPCRGLARIDLSAMPSGDIILDLLDASGRKVGCAPVKAGSRAVSLDLRRLPSGIYFVREAASGERSTVRVTKVVLQR